MNCIVLSVMASLLMAHAPINIWKGTSCHKTVELTPYPAKEMSGKEMAVIVCPGGSYFWHDTGTEGVEVARWLQQNGISAFVLNYRTAYVPAFIFHHRLVARGNRYPDAQDDLRQALHYVRRHASAYGINTGRIGVMGFSAGGHLAMWSAEYLGAEERPAFVAAVYPVVTMYPPYVHKRSRRGLLGDSRVRNSMLRDQLSLERHVPRDCPPVFLVNCADDPVVDYHNSVLLDSALTARDIPHHYRLYSKGGHGFGVSSKKGSEECRRWKDDFLKWVKELLNP